MFLSDRSFRRAAVAVPWRGIPGKVNAMRGGAQLWMRAASLSLVAMVMGCGGSDSGTSGPGGSTSGKDAGGSLVVDGSSTVYRISREAQIDFRNVAPNDRVSVANHGTGGGFDRYMQGEVDIIDASRDAKPEETTMAVERKMPWTRFLVAYDGITVVVNPKNDFVKSLTVDQLKQLFAPNGTVVTWKDLDPSWPDRKIVLYAPGTASGTFDFFSEAVVGKGTTSNRKGVQASEDDNTLVTGVSGDNDALGYFGYAYYQANKAKLRAVAIRSNAEAEAVEPTQETVLNGTYTPLSRPLYIFVKNEVLKRPVGERFIKHYLDNVAKFAEKAGYMPPTEADRAANIEVFQQATSSASAKPAGSAS